MKSYDDAVQSVNLTNGLKRASKNGNATFQYLAAFTGTLTIITSGMHYGWPSPSLPQLLSNTTTIPITNDEGSWIAAMPLIGNFFGALMAIFLTNNLGRKRSILLTCPPYFIAWIMVAFSKSVLLLCIARFIAGITDGWVFNCVPIYMGEIADPKIRGRLCAVESVAWILGALLISIMGSYLSIQTAALVASGLPVIAFLTFIWMPESPYYLLMKRNYEEAKKCLQMLRGQKDVDSELHRISDAVEEDMGKTGRVLDLFTVKSNRRAIVATTILRSAQQLSGTAAITFYTQFIFKEAGETVSTELATMIYFAIELVSASLCCGIVDKTGRRPLLIISLSGTSIFLLIEGVYFYIKSSTNLDVASFTFIPVAALIGYVAVFAVGGLVIPISMQGELFSVNIKCFAICYTSMYYCVSAVIVSKCFQIMKDSLGMYAAFFVFSCCSVLNLVLIYFYVPETKGKTLEEIQMYFRRKKRY